MNKETLTISPPLSYFFINNIHIALLIGVSFLFKGYFPEYVSVAIGIFILLLFFRLGYNYLYFLSIKFIITEERVISEIGFFNTKIDYLEMYRIYDYQMNRSLLQKVLNLMNVDLITRDITNPILKLHGISYNSTLVDEIRNRVEHSKKINNILELNQIT
jgi:uncharacterized membrane protein YdbT with pleckstrin-like domain